MTLDIIQRVKDGEQITLKYSFLSDKMNSILTKYVNNNIQKQVLERSVKNCSADLIVAKDLRKVEEIAKLEEELDRLKSKFENVRFMRLNLKERRTMADIRKKIRNKKETLKKEQDEISEIQTLFDILNIKL